MADNRNDDRFELGERLGKGGMGEVYRAYDRKLDRTVAVKLIRGDRLDEADVRERFEREARAAAALTHPAIVRIYDILAWGEDRDAIVMELVEGRTLGELIRAGPLALTLALTLARDVARALALAHSQSIVHRDLKTSNVMVTAEGRAKVLDFGMARRLGQSALTASGTVVGTLHAMSPEQVGGEDVDGRSDLFSFGTLLYEALTGEAPFLGATVSETAIRIASHHPPPVRERNPEAPEEISELVGHLLEKDPDNRPADAEVVEVLERLRDTSSTASVVDPDFPTEVMPAPGDVTTPRPPRRVWLVAALVLAALTAALVLPTVLREPPPVEAPAEATSPAAVRRAVAVLDFESRDGRSGAEWLGPALAELVRGCLAAGDEIRVVHGRRMLHLESDLGPEARGPLSPEHRERLRLYLAVDVLVGGSYRLLAEDGGLLEVTVRVADPASGEVRDVTSVSGTEASLAPLVRRAADPVRRTLGLPALTPRQGVAVDASLPAEVEAARLAVEERLRAPPDAASAIATWQPVFEAFPDDLDAGLLLAEAQIAAGQPEAALATLGKLDDLPAAAGHPRVALAAAWAWQHLGDAREMRKSATELFRRAEPVGGALVADARRFEARALYRLGEIEAATAAIDDAIRRYRTWSEAARGLALAYELKAYAVREQGDLAGARQLFESALESHQRRDEHLHVAWTLQVVGTLLYLEGRAAAAEASFGEARALFDELDAPFEEASWLVNVGTFYQEQGRLDEALDKYTSALALFQQLNDDRSIAVTLTNVGELRYLGADLDGSRRMHEEARGLNRELGDAVGAAYDTWRLGRVLAARGDWVVARQHYGDAVRQQETLGEHAAVAETRLGLAELELWEDAPGRAETLAREAEEVLRTAGLADPVSRARTLLARSLLRQDRLDEAAAVLAEVGDVAGPTRWAVARTEALLRSKRGDAVGVAVLEEAAAEAETAGLVLDAFETRLVLGEVTVDVGRLATLREEAEARGVGGVARRVEALLTGRPGKFR